MRGNAIVKMSIIGLKAESLRYKAFVCDKYIAPTQMTLSLFKVQILALSFKLSAFSF